MSAGADEDIRGLNVAMHDSMDLVKVYQAVENCLGDLTQNIDTDRARVFRNTIERASACQILTKIQSDVDLPAVHVLHTHDDIARVVEERAVEVDNIRVAAVVHDVELSDDLFPYILLGFHVDDLPRV